MLSMELSNYPAWGHAGLGGTKRHARLPSRTSSVDHTGQLLLRVPRSRFDFCDLFVVSNGMQRHVDEPLIRIERAEYRERMRQRMFLYGHHIFAGKLQDFDALLLKPLLDLSVGEPLARHY